MDEPIPYREPRTTRRVQRVVRHDTGEEFDQTVEEKKRGTARTPAKRKGFGMLWPKELASVQLRGTDWRVFWKLVDMADFDTGIVRYTGEDIAVAEGPNAAIMAHGSVKRLVDAGLVRRIGRGKVQLNPVFVWKGDLDGSLSAYQGGNEGE